MTASITLTKGGTTITIDTTEISDEWNNDIIIIKPPQTKQKQASGPKDSKVIDLLKLTHEMLVRGWISPTSSLNAKQVKNNLITMFKGSNTVGGPIVVAHEGSNFNMFLTSLTIIDSPMDEPSTLQTNIAKYSIQLTLVEGVSI